MCYMILFSHIFLVILINRLCFILYYHIFLYFPSILYNGIDHVLYSFYMFDHVSAGSRKQTVYVVWCPDGEPFWYMETFSYIKLLVSGTRWVKGWGFTSHCLLRVFLTACFFNWACEAVCDFIARIYIASKNRVFVLSVYLELLTFDLCS